MVNRCVHRDSSVNAPRPPSYGPVYDSIVSAVRAEHAEAWATGERMTLDEAVDEASSNAGADDRPEA